MSTRRPYIATTVLPTIPAKDYSEWGEHIHNSLREGYPSKRVSVAIDREDNTVCFYNAEGDEVRRERLDRIMGDRCMEVDSYEGDLNPASYSTRYVGWQDLGTDNFRELAEDQVKWWAKQQRLDVDDVEFC